MTTKAVEAAATAKAIERVMATETRCKSLKKSQYNSIHTERS